MRLRIDLSSLGEKDRVLNAITAALGTSARAAKLRVERSMAEESDSLRKDVLVELLRLADRKGVPWSEVLRLQKGSIFDLLPGATTYTYLGGYGKADEEVCGYSESITVSVCDYRAARRLAHRITNDASKLRFAPSLTLSAESIVRKLDSEASNNSQTNASVIAVGSPKVNAMTEWLLAQALGLTPFSPRAAAQPEPPFVFQFSLLDDQARILDENKQRCNSRFVRVARESGHSRLRWNQRTFSYQPPVSVQDAARRVGRPRRTAPPLEYIGTDYGVVLVEAVGRSRAHVVIAGLTGAATYGAAALLCQKDDLFHLPPSPPYVQVFLIEVKFSIEGRLRQVREARVAALWSKRLGSTAFEEKSEHWVKILASPVTAGP